MQEIKSNIFLAKSLEQVPRLLSQLNRSPRSGTYGCFDRNYWLLHTSFIPNVRKQEALYTLALLYSHNFDGNIYYQDAQIMEWIRAVVIYTAKIQHREGSFDESFYNERSFVCTSFVLLSLLQTFAILPETRNEKIIQKAVNFVRNDFETTAYNQTAGNILALFLAGERKIAFVKLGRFLSDQNSEGWWSEYGGPDFGYLSLTIDYLDQIFEITGDPRVKNSIDKARDFVYNFLHPDFTCGGEYMSRNTEYLIPSNDQKILNFSAKQLELNTAVWPGTMSDDYLLPLLSHWIRAGLAYRI
ncbi:MAG TPA: hypothetical protein VJI73_01515 [Candidatus Paceibacterota bacterium]